MFTKKAKAVIFFLSLFSASSALYADVRIPETTFQEKIDLEPHEDELATIDRMIALTLQQNEALNGLKILIEDLRRNKELFMKGEPSKLHASYMVRSAQKSLQLIRAHHLEHLFSSDFMEELALFAQIGNK